MTPRWPATDVTHQVSFGEVDAESLPLTQCICGAKWQPWEGPVLSIYEQPDAATCPECHRQFFFRNSIRVYQRGD